MVLQKLWEHQWYTKFSKCEFWLNYEAFLGYVVLKEEVIVDPTKMAVVREWPQLKNTSEVCSFLGLASYYKKFVKEFSKIALPLTSLTCKGKKFEWTEQCEKSFQEIKKKLKSAPMLIILEGADGLLSKVMLLR